MTEGWASAEHCRGCSLSEMLSTGNYCALNHCFLMFGFCCQLKFQCGPLVWDSLAVTFRELCPRDIKGFSSSLFWAVHFSLQLCEPLWEFCLGSWCCWLSSLGGISYLDFGPVFGSVYATWRLFCEAISHKLAQKEVILLIKLPFPVHVHQD